MTIATSLSCSLRFSTVSEGGGTMLPSVFISANCWSNRSVIDRLTIVPLSATPTKTKPGFSCPAKSLAKAQIASLILVAASRDKDSLNSTRSDSPVAMSCSHSSSVKSGIALVSFRYLPATASHQHPHVLPEVHEMPPALPGLYFGLRNFRNRTNP